MLCTGWTRTSRATATTSCKHVQSRVTAGLMHSFMSDVSPHDLLLLLQMADYIRNERNVLDRMHHPGVAALHFTFQVCAGCTCVAEQAATSSFSIS